EQLTQRLAAITEARRSVAMAVEQDTAASAERLTEMKAEAATLETELAARREAVLAEARASVASMREQEQARRQARLAAVQQELAAARQVAQQQEAAYFAADQALAAADRQQAAAAVADERVARLEKELAQVRQELQLKRDNQPLHETRLASLITPANLLEPVVGEADDVRRRMMITAGTAGGVALLFLVLILHTIAKLMRETSRTPVTAEETSAANRHFEPLHHVPEPEDEPAAVPS
ncbi:MAG: hypothetical protein ACFCVE_02930, partial [Phycisphaerae bacterium]